MGVAPGSLLLASGQSAALVHWSLVWRACSSTSKDSNSEVGLRLTARCAVD